MNANDLTKLKDKVDEIRGNLAAAKAAGRVLNEANTELEIIDPLLGALGYKTGESERQCYNSFANSYLDYMLLPQTPQKWILEVKKLDQPLQNADIVQIGTYAITHGIQWAVLTNGRTWYIYNNRVPNPLPERKVFEVTDLFGDDKALETLALLSRNSMFANGLAEAWTFQQVKETIKTELETPDSSVRKQLRKSVNSKITPTISDAVIGQALRSLFLTAPSVKANMGVPVPAPPPPSLKPTPSMGQTLYTFAEVAADSTLSTGKKPIGLHFADGSFTQVNSWADAAIQALARVGQQFTLPPIPYTNSAKGKTYFLNTQPKHSTGTPMLGSKQMTIKGQTVFMHTNRSSHDMASVMAALMKAAGAPSDFVKVSIG